MPLFDYRCPDCDYKAEYLVPDTESPVSCPDCCTLMLKLPPTCSFKIKGLRAANGYGLKFMDTYGKSPVTDKETGATFNSNRGMVVDHNFGTKDGSNG